MTDQAGDIVADDKTNTDDAAKAAETAKAATTESSKPAADTKTAIADKAADGAVKEFVADASKTDEENAAALAEFEKANEAAAVEKDGADKGKSPLPDNWRELAAGENEDLLKLAKRYGSISGILKALDESKKALRTGRQSVAKPDPSDEKAMAEWRKAEGIPDKPEGYKLPDTVVKRLTDDDKPLLSSFTEFAHTKGARPDVVEIASEWYITMQEQAAAKMSEEDKLASESAEDALRKDWAHGEFKSNTTIAKRWIESVPGLGADWAEARMPNGRRLGDNPDFVSWAADMGRNKFGDLAFSTGDGERKHVARKQEIETMMANNIDEYYRSGADKEYADILAKEERRQQA